MFSETALFLRVKDVNISRLSKNNVGSNFFLSETRKSLVSHKAKKPYVILPRQTSRVPIQNLFTNCVILYKNCIFKILLFHENIMALKQGKVKVSVMSTTLWRHGLYSPWNSPGQNIGVGSLSLLQGIFTTQGLNPHLPHCRQSLYQLSHKGSPSIPE